MQLSGGYAMSNNDLEEEKSFYRQGYDLAFSKGSLPDLETLQADIIDFENREDFIQGIHDGGIDQLFKEVTSDLKAYFRDTRIGDPITSLITTVKLAMMITGTLDWRLRKPQRLWDRKDSDTSES